MNKLILILIFYLKLFDSFGQAYKYNHLNESGVNVLLWNDKNEITKETISTSYSYANQSTSICSHNGQLLLYSNNVNVYDSKHQIIAKNLLPSDFGLMFLQINDSTYWLLQNYENNNSTKDLSYFTFLNEMVLMNNPFGLYYTELIKKPSGFICTKRNQLLLEYKKTLNINSFYSFKNMMRVKDYNYVFTTQKLTPQIDIVYVCLINQNGFKITDSIDLRNKVILSEFRNKEALNLPNVKVSHQIMNCGFSRNTDKFLYTISSKIEQIINPVMPLKLLHSSSSFVSVKFNNQTGKFLPFADTIKHSEKGEPIKYSFSNYPLSSFVQSEDFIFSTNDSFVFLQENENIYKKVAPYSDSISNFTNGFLSFRNNYQFHSILEQNVEFNNSNKKSKYLKINHLGNFYQVYDIVPKYQIITELTNSNKPHKDNIINHHLNNKFDGIFLVNPTLYQYGKIKYSVEYKDCKAYVKFDNQTDESLGLNQYSWTIASNKAHSAWFKTSSKNPQNVVYKESGVYLFKIHITSDNKTNYSEWYFDSIYIDIPKRPIASFNTKDSIVCRYKGLFFNNLSQSEKSSIETYLWNFGDGNTSNEKTPNHTYTKTGNYSVTLKYSNGFCDSVMVKKNYINIVDAPKPGFEINTLQGCAPLEIVITDTTKRHVSSKDYFISDGNQWIKFSEGQNQLKHLFEKAGRYRAVQKLSGYTGCITMSDSVWINVSKGLSIQDSVHILKSTVKTEEEISLTGKCKLYRIVPGHALLEWKVLKGAVQYQIVKNNSPYHKTSDTFYYDTRDYDKDAEYCVYGIDSCGNQSSIGHRGKPVFLNTDMIGKNEAVVVNFSPYLTNNKEMPNYQIQKLSNTSSEPTWENIVQKTDIQEFKDKNITDENHLQVCYRIAVFENKTLISFSNIACVPMVPILFIPTGFSPNNDGVNDQFELKVYGVQNYKLKIFNRWGEQVFEGSENQAWTGENCIEGEYTVMIEYVTNNGVKYFKHSTVTLIK